MRRFGPENYLKRTDRLEADLLNPIFASLDAALDELERFKELNWQEQVDLFSVNALKRLNDAIKPVVDRIRTAASGGFLVATTADLVALVEGQDVNFYIPPEARTAFSPTPFVVVMASDEIDDWAFGRRLVYNEVTGLLTVRIMRVNGSGAERSGWTVAASAGVAEAVSGWLEEIRQMYVEILFQASQVKTARDDAVAAAEAAVPAAQIVTDRAAEVAANALAIFNALAAIAAGPVVSIDGEQGIVTGIARRRWVLSQLSLKTDKAFVKAETIKTSRRRANAYRLFN